MFGRLAVAAACLLPLGVAFASPAGAAPAYTLTKSTPLGLPDRWDYVVFNAPTQRVYIAHVGKLEVIDARSGDLVGTVAPIPGGSHGTGILTSTGQGFTDDGINGQAIAFDLKTLKITKQIPADKDADGIVTDAATGHIFVIEGDPNAVGVIDPKTDTVVATIKVGEGPEYGASDDQGTVYIAGNGNGDIIRIDARTNTVLAHWAAPDCKRPHGLALDRVGHRLFMGCVNSVMMVMNSDNGHLVAELPIGKGSDAIAFDPKRKRVFSPNGVDGTLSIFQQTSPDAYTPLETLTTAVSGRTMSVDPETGRLFIVAADTDPPTSPNARARPKPGTTKVLIYDPVN